uniref:Uncharacterized protein n=1 Tax=Anguilla anguilla TaxID=7936 RepID=A0A0E9QUB2_ANGAN
MMSQPRQKRKKKQTLKECSVDILKKSLPPCLPLENTNVLCHPFSPTFLKKQRTTHKDFSETSEYYSLKNEEPVFRDH